MHYNLCKHQAAHNKVGERGSKYAEYFVNCFGLLVGPRPLQNITSVSLDLVYKMTTLVVVNILYTVASTSYGNTKILSNQMYQDVCSLEGQSSIIR